jgi:hypothetical protein
MLEWTAEASQGLIAPFVLRHVELVVGHIRHHSVERCCDGGEGSRGSAAAEVVHLRHAALTEEEKGCLRGDEGSGKAAEEGSGGVVQRVRPLQRRRQCGYVFGDDGSQHMEVLAFNGNAEVSAVLYDSRREWVSVIVKVSEV